MNSKSSGIKDLVFQLSVIGDYDSGGLKPEREQIQKKIEIRKHRRVPVVKLFFLLVVIVLTLVALEYFI